MRNVLSRAVSLLITLALLVLMFSIGAVGLVFACVVAGDVRSCAIVLGVVVVVNAVVCSIAARAYLRRSIQANQLVREDLSVVVAAALCMLCFGSLCTVSSLDMVPWNDAAANEREVLAVVNIAQIVICCMALLRVYGFTKSAVERTRVYGKVVRVLLLVVALLTAAEFCASLYGAFQLNSTFGVLLFERSRFTFEDVIWFELVLSGLKLVAATSSAALLRNPVRRCKNAITETRP